LILTYEKLFETIPAGNYILEIVTDINKNGRWDTGNYDSQSQPEPLISKKLDELREGWDLDAPFSIDLKRNEQAPEVVKDIQDN